MDLMANIQEQSSLGLTGKINVLLHDNRQFIGALFLLQGHLVNATYLGRQGRQALIHLVFDDEKKHADFRFIIEQEVIGPGHISFNLTFKDFKEFIQGLFSKHKEAIRLRPPAHLALLVNASFISHGPPITPEEFDVLSTISNYRHVRDIYRHTPLQDFEITWALVSLRKKGAIKVLSS